MIRINLLPTQEAERAAGRRQELAVGTFVLVLAVVGLFAAHAWQRLCLGSLQRQVRRVTVELADIQGPYADVTHMEQQKQELRDKLRVIGELEAKKVGPVRILADLSTATPDKLWLTEFTETSGKLKLSGLGVDEQTVADFLRRLAAVPFFHGVDLEETSQVDQEGAKLKKFVISGQVDFAAEAPEKHAAADRPAAGEQ
ncbi:MAG: PilN domain-containing protein [Deltaproteobacteria bacterium]|nr:MAG: PilN domain-containing protein [Deltaproteobacteria bacterium]TMB16632.1 MAG: PilN domain-containing protein [Deltaproteobacteria bacterium]